MAGIKEALGKFNITPPLDFDTDGSIEYSAPTNTDLQTNDTPYIPKVHYNPNYNPFNYKSGISIEESDFEKPTHTASHFTPREKVPANWDTLFEDLKEKQEPVQTSIPEMSEETTAHMPNSSFIQMKGRYIVSPVRSGLMLIDQKRAHERILFEQYTSNLAIQKAIGQKCLFPETLELSATDFTLVKELNEDLEYLGFELGEFGKNCFAIYATPADFSCSYAKKILLQLIEHYKNTEGDIREKMKERLALSLAKAASINYNTTLDNKEMSDMMDNLFASKYPNFTPDGKTIIHILKYEDVNTWFK